MKRDRGFVLVHALLIVAALSAAAVFLLARANEGRLRLEARQTTDQLEAYLDAFEALAQIRLNRDLSTGIVDHDGEAWARADLAVEVDRGTISGVLRDEQGFFNLNWLANPEDTSAQQAFAALFERAGISSVAGDAIRAFLRPGGPERRTAYLRGQPSLDPVGGAALMVEQLTDIPGLAARDLQKLRKIVTALPGDSRLNVNTASPALLAAFLPDLTASMMDRVVQARQAAPFASVEAFITVVETLTGAGMEDELKARFAVGSDWFGMQVEAELLGRTAGRLALLQRQPRPRGTVVRWRISTYD